LGLVAERKLSPPLPKTPLRIFVVFVAFFLPPTRAQSPGPREFLNIPVRQTVAYVDYVATNSETVAADLSLPNNVSVNRAITPTILVSFPLNNKYAGL